MKGPAVPENDPILPETNADPATTGAADDPAAGERPAYPTVRRLPGVLAGRLGFRIAGQRGLRVAGLVGLLGLAIVGVSTATLVGADGGDTPSRVTVAQDEAARAAAAQRADRSAREAPTTGVPTPAPTASPSATATAPTTPRATRKASKASKASTAKPKRPAWVNPMPGAPVTSCYGMRWGALHAGIDLAMPSGTPIHAAGAGTVVTAGPAYTGYGISVVIDHGNGYLTHYAHQSRVAVSVGQKVSAGQVIGYEGATGDATGPHLHFEVHKGLWNQVDPAPWMRARGVDLGC
ncbi:M23 family metallopeptidase [Plantactinospora sonchi]|uniref:Peptidoglycan DD-metalloendopeptidase family protein n=1 Tax=Plantactinospora sonchi TaxID=1544735 RepID=A0ABU7S3H7_9ACTN